MADSKITALTAISTVDPAADPLVIVDVSDTSMAASGTTKKATINQLLGASGTATLASATITGDLTVDTNTLKVDSANNRVGIGTASPSTALDVFGGNIRLVGGNIFQILNTSNDSNVDISNNGGSGVASMLFKVAGTSAMTLNSTGLDIANGNVILGTSGKGIDFSATASGSGTMTSELLSDYEEGTFTPIVRGSTTSGTGTYTTQFGRYTKVGRLVTVTVTLNWTAHTGTGNLQFAGLPFVSANTASAYDGIAIAYQSNISSAANTVLYGLVEFGSTVVTMTATPVGGGGYGLVAMDTAGEIAFTVTYTV